MARPTAAQNERNVLILTGVGHFSARWFELMFPTLAVALAHQQGLPLEQVLGWSFLGYLLFGLSALPAGLLADRLGARPLLLSGLFGVGVAALAASEAASGRALSICLAVMGGFAGIYHPVGMRLISRTIDAPGRALGVNAAFGNGAVVLTPVLTAALCSQIGWQGAYRITGYVMCGLAVACAFLRVDEHAPRPAAAAAPPAAPSRRAALLLLLAAATLTGISYRGITLLQPAYFAQRVTEMGYGVATSLAYLAGIAGQFAAGRLADRHDLPRLYLGFHALSLPALLVMMAVAGLPLLGSAALFLFLSLAMQPIENRLLAQYTPGRWRATAYGVKFVCSCGLGSLAVWLVRWADGVGGLPFALACLAGVVLLVVALAALLPFVTGDREGAAAPAAAATWLPTADAPAPRATGLR